MLEARMTLAALEAGVKKQENEEREDARLEKEAESKGHIYLNPRAFDVEFRFPSRKEFSEIKALLMPGDEIWRFSGLDSGWVVLRDDSIVHQLVTNHEY